MIARVAGGLGAVLLALTACTTSGHAVTQSPPPPQTSRSTSPVPTLPVPTSPVPTLPAHSIGPTVPPVSAAARAAGLVDIRTIVPDAVVDLRYATRDNFTHVQLYPTGARCLVHQTMLPGLREAAAVLRGAGYVLVFWDCYRPHSVQERMWKVVPNPAWVARPRSYAYSHEAGRSVDVTLATASSHRLLDMGTGFDDFTSRAHAFATTGLSPAQVANRARLRRAMADGGLTVYSGEWWHFDGPGSRDPRPILGVPL